ncbi:MAG TPA: S41 family peptidase [Bryobacteraceae bacterium]|nr:S41 family peptidase [Bryobacteraceae bacterium]
MRRASEEYESMAIIPRKYRSLLVIPVLVVAAAVVGGFYGPNPQVASAATGDDDISASVRDFTRLYSTVEQNFADPVNADKAIYNGAIPGMLRTLDPHSNFFDPKALAQMREDQRGHYYGVGMRIEGRLNQAGVMQTVIVEPFVGSPAYKAGLRPNDVLANVNGKSTDGLTSSDVADLLKGPKGTPVEIKVLRGEGADSLTVSIVRDEINRSSIPLAFMIKPGIGYVKIDEFIETTGSDFDAALKKLEEDNLKGLILDLRGNPGGLLTEAVHVAGHLLPKGVEIVSHRGRASREKSYTALEGNHGRNYPIVVVVNRNSASASEIVSGALQDHDRAWIFGDNTFGKGLVQTVYPLAENTGLALTTAHYYTPSGRLIQRDYSSVSFFDYYYRANTEARNPADVKMTDSGRTVYGGGGISPDQKFEVPKPGPLETDLYVKYMFRNYTKHFFTAHKDPLPKGWKFDAAQMKEFHDWLLAQKYDLNEAQFTKEYEAIRRRMQSEFYKTAFNVDDSTRYIIETDPEISAAIEALPKAQALVANANRIRAERAKK